MAGIKGLQKGVIGGAVAAVECGVLVWIPALLGSFDEHTAMFFLIAVYCPFVVVPVLCMTTWLLKPEGRPQRLWLPALLATVFVVSSACAIALRANEQFSGLFAETFWFVVAWLECELLILTVAISFRLTRTPVRRRRTAAAFLIANTLAAGLVVGLYLARVDMSYVTFMGISALAYIFANGLAYLIRRVSLHDPIPASNASR